MNLIYDSVGALGTPSSYFYRLRAAGVCVLEFNPVNPLSTRKPWALNHRDHRKLLIVDGRAAFPGGINISSVYSSGSSGRRRSVSTDEAGARVLARQSTAFTLAPESSASFEPRRLPLDIDKRHRSGRAPAHRRQCDSTRRGSIYASISCDCL
ncbi:hypothetical protein [Burkholderia sp. LFS061]|uniref:hypothetical protein n=1 Tax=Burkholderia sp. LFS061 TaxID=3229885 RepID=UPI003A80A87B